jgi:hypothetical protein
MFGASSVSVQSIQARVRGAFLIAAAMLLAACVSMPRPLPLAAPRATGTMKPYEVGGHWYYPAEQPHYNEVGLLPGTATATATAAASPPTAR